MLSPSTKPRVLAGQQQESDDLQLPSVMYRTPPRGPDRSYVDPLMSIATPDSISDAASFNQDVQLTFTMRRTCLQMCLGGMGTDMGRRSTRRAAKVALLLVAFFVAMAQWSALASGVAFFSDVVGLGEDGAAMATNAAFSVCFIFSVVGGIFGDAHLGSLKVLYRGLLLALSVAFVMTILAFPVFDIDSMRGTQVAMAVLMFLYAAAAGLCQTAIPALVGDQCWDEPERLSSFYPVFYAFLQAGAFIARIVFPLLHDEFGWFVALAAMMTAPLSVAVLIVALNSTVIAYKAPLPYSVALRAARALTRHYCCCASRDDIEVEFGDDLVRDALRSAAVLRLHAPLPVFWSLYFLVFSIWYIQTKQLDLRVLGGHSVNPEQVTALNPLFDVILLAVFGAFFAALRRLCGTQPSAKGKIAIGYACAISAFISATVLQHHINVARNEHGVNKDDEALHKLPLWAQVPQFIFMCAAEVLLYPAALHLVYVHSPVSMRSFVQSVLWFFIGVGNAADMVVMGAASASDGSKLGNNLAVYIGYTVALAAAAALYLLLARQYDLHAVDAHLITMVSSGGRHYSSSGLGSSPERPSAINAAHPSDIARALDVDYDEPLLLPADGGNSVHASTPRPAGLAVRTTTSPVKPQRSQAGSYAGPETLLGAGTAAQEGNVERRRPISPRDTGANSTVVYYSTRRKSNQPSQFGSFHTRSYGGGGVGGAGVGNPSATGSVQ